MLRLCSHHRRSHGKPDSIVMCSGNPGYNGLGRYISRGYDTYGLFKLVGGLQKGNPTEEEIKRAVDFYKNLL